MSIYSRQILLTNPITLILLSLSVFKFFEDRRERERETETESVTHLSVCMLLQTYKFIKSKVFFFLIEVQVCTCFVCEWSRWWRWEEHHVVIRMELKEVLGVLKRTNSWSSTLTSMAMVAGVHSQSMLVFFFFKF